MKEQQLSYEAKDWLEKYVVWGIQKSSLGLTKEIINEFKQKGLQLPRKEVLYRVIAPYKNEEKKLFKKALNIEWDEMEIGETRFGVRYVEDRITSWSKSEQLVIEDFDWGSYSFLIESFIEPQDTIVDTTLFDKYVKGFQQDEVIVKPGTYKCILKRIS